METVAICGTPIMPVVRDSKVVGPVCRQDHLKERVVLPDQSVLVVLRNDRSIGLFQPQDGIQRGRTGLGIEESRHGIPLPPCKLEIVDVARRPNRSGHNVRTAEEEGQTGLIIRFGFRDRTLVQIEGGQDGPLIDGDRAINTLIHPQGHHSDAGSR